MMFWSAPSSAFLLLLLLGCGRGQLMAPQLPENYQPKQYPALFQGINMCAYKEVLMADGTTTLAWTCGLTDNRKNGKIAYDCCPGYKKTALVNNQCVEKEATYRPIGPTLQEMPMQETSDIFQKVLPDLENENSPAYTVFVPKLDEGIRGIAEKDIKSMIVDGRHYSGDFKNGATLKSKSGYPLKVSTYPNGLVFIECQLLSKPDMETANGLIHTTSGPIDAQVEMKTVLQRLQADSDFSSFLADIPSDLRQKLSSPDASTRYTVFAPTNAAWQEAKRSSGGSQSISDLVKQHVVESLVCGQSFDGEAQPIGPSSADTFASGVQLPDGSRVIEDACGATIRMKQMDLMAGNGAVHKLDGVIQSPASMDLNGALACLAKSKGNDMSQAAREMGRCNINVNANENAVVLIPTSKALGEKPNMLGGDPCATYQNNVLTSRDCKVKNGHGIGLPQECVFNSKYTAPGGRRPSVTNQYIRTREGSQLHFGKAVTDSLKPIPFKDGVIFPAANLNPPPTKTMIEIIKGDPDLSDTFSKIQQAGFTSMLSQNSPNVVFFAPQNHGWKTREKEEVYGSGQLRKLFEMHTVPHQLITGDDGTIGEETIQTVQPLSSTELKIKRTLDGNTFIGYDGLPEEDWILAIGEPIVATDGIVWVVDWPLVCNNC